MLKYVMAIFFFTLLLKFVSTFRVYNKLGSSDLRFLSPVLDIAYTLYLLIIFFLLLLKPKNSWT